MFSSVINSKNMSVFEIKMPKLGESITEGTIISWSVKVGDIIHDDDILFEVTTAKVNAEVPSPVSGTISKILFNEGDTVPVGEVVALVQLESEEMSDNSGNSSTVQELAEEVTKNEIKTTEPSEKLPPLNSAKNRAEESRWYSPVVLQLAQEANIPNEELDRIPGNGYLGRLTKHDISNYIERKKKGAAPLISETTPQSATEKKQVPPVMPGSPIASSMSVPSGNNSDESIEMDPVRRIIADRMVQSKAISPHVTTVVEADVTKLVKWREKEKDAFKKHEGITLTFLPAIIQATTRALIDFPLVNTSVEGHNIILKKRINMGIAVSLDDGNLIVPVIHDADKLSLSGLALAVDSLAIKARSNKLKLEEIQGGTFTITNFGTFKNIIGTPIINQPEVAILGVGYIEKKPAVIETPEGDVIAIRHKMYLSLTYDHRIINGALGGAFVRRIADYLEKWGA
jgi:2-oxoglutarate dehydrogenase E2 component (dihydrolipoamide succinyltransferase)